MSAHSFKQFATIAATTVIAAAVAVSVIAVPAASAVNSYDTTVTLNWDSPSPPEALFHGNVISADNRCAPGRQVVLYKRQPVGNLKLGVARSIDSDGDGEAG